MKILSELFFKKQNNVEEIAAFREMKLGCPTPSAHCNVFWNETFKFSAFSSSDFSYSMPTHLFQGMLFFYLADRKYWGLRLAI